MGAIALTDSGVMYGAVDFYQACKGHNLKPIIGAEVFVAHKSRFDRSEEERKPYQLVLLASTNQGYLNLIQLITRGQLEGMFEKPLIDWDSLVELHEGIIALSGDHTGELGQALLQKDIIRGKEIAQRHLDLFGKDNYFLEIARHGIEAEQVMEPYLFTLSKELGIPLVATNNSHYPNTSDREAHDALICVKNQKLISDPNRPRYNGNYSILSEEEMRALFSDIPEACDITQTISDRCNVEIALGKSLLPPFDCPPGLSVPEYLYQLCIEGAKRRYGDPLDEAIIKQIDYELGIINKTGFPSYFLIVWDFINWSKTHGVAVGPGRGSAAGAIVTYVLGITDIDPRAHGLVFERFLNPERVSPPDIDIDFADDAREKVINYVVEKYGRDSVAQIITFGTMGAKAAIRDVGRVLGCGYKDVDSLAKLIPLKPGTKMKDAIAQEPLLKETLEKNPTHQQIWQLALKLEGVVRHASTHASAVVIASGALVQYTPLQKNTAGKDEGVVTQYSMKPLESLGLLKMDFLGLRNLTVLSNTADIIQNHYGVDLDWQHLDTEDKDSYLLLSQGKTTGVFQLESQGMKHYLKELKPTKFEDITAMISLYRPGPIEAIPDFIAAKNGKKEVTYLDPELEPILNKTYGVIVYQEQVLEIARVFGGFSYGEADILRRAVGKKIKELLMEQRQKFIDKASARGKSPAVAEKIWDFIEPFARYGFNKSHAACYAMIAYQTAYLKSHFPAAFMAALMSCDRGNTDRIVIEIEECRILGLQIHPPSINASEINFTVENEQDIRFGLGAIKNLGDVPSGHIAEVRKNGGPFTSLQNFLERIDPTLLNRKSLEALIKANAFADIAKADVMMNNLDELVNYLGTLRKLRDTPADSLFADMLELNAPAHFNLKEPEKSLSDRDILKWEKEALGLYLSGHPLDYLKPLMAEEIPRLDKITPSFEGKKVKISGMIMQAKRIITKSGSAMCFIELENSFGKIEGIIFAKAMPTCQEECKEENIVTAAGTISFRDNRSGQQAETPKFLIDSLVPFVIPTAKSDSQKQAAKPYIIPVPASITSNQLNALKNILSAHPGTHPVELELTSPLQKSTIIHLPDRIEPSPAFQESITAFHATFTQ